MKHIGKVLTYLILSVNALFVGMLLLTAYSPHIAPTGHPLQSCIGLTFPVFLVINACFLFFWLVVRYKLALLSLIGFLLCYSQIQTYFPINFRTSDIPEKSIKLLSYNTMVFSNMAKKNGKNPILTYIQESNADIVCMQEYATSETAKKHLNEKNIREGFKDYPYRSIKQVGKNNLSNNKLACYSKFPILSSRVVKYNSNYNGSVVYEILVNEDTITVINNHLESNKLTKDDKIVYETMLKEPKVDNVKSGARLLINKLAEASAIRSKQAEVIAEEIAASAHPYIIVCGDFNDSPISYTHRVIAKELDDAFTESGRGLGISYNQNKFYFRIDNILISKNLKAYNCTVDRSIKASDHYPIWCYISKR